MKVFITGASGLIGLTVVEELLSHGHQVLALARSDAAADALTKAGAEPHRGHLTDIESLRSGAKASDGVIHLAYTEDMDNDVDRAAIEAMADGMAGTNNPLVMTSVVLITSGNGVGTEESNVHTSKSTQVLRFNA